MLVLARKKGQAIMINENIELTIVDIQGDLVRIGINAPKSVKLLRKEIYEEILDENKRAVMNNSLDLKGLKIDKK